MSEQPSQAHACSRCGQDTKGSWVCAHCGHVDVAYYIGGAAIALFCIAIAIVATIALSPARSGGRIAALAGADLVCGGTGLIVFLVVLSEIKKGVHLLRQLGDRSSGHTMRKAIGWVIGLSVVGILVSAGVGLYARGGLERSWPTPSSTRPALQPPGRYTSTMVIGLAFALPGIILAVVAFRKKHRGRGIAILVAMLVAVNAVLILGDQPFNPDTIGRRGGKPVAVGMPVSIENLTLVVTRVSTSRMVSATRMAINARKMCVSVQVTCDLAPGETCSLDSYKWELGGLSISPSLSWSGRIDEIGGGETVVVELSTAFLSDTTSLAGARLEFSMLQRVWSLWRSAYLDL